MGRTTAKYLFPYPTTGDPADGPAGFQRLAERVETVLGQQLTKLDHDLRLYVGGVSGYASMRAYVDHQDVIYNTNIRNAFKAADAVVTNAYIKADTKVKTDVTTAYTAADKDIKDTYNDALNKACQIYSGVMIGSMAPIGVGESRAVSNEFTIPGSPWRRILVVQCAGAFDTGYGIIQIKMDGSIRRQARTAAPDQSAFITYCIELPINTSYLLQMIVVGRAPNVSGAEVNALNLSGQWSFIQAYTILGGG